jgi:hypothetical protein
MLGSVARGAFMADAQTNPPLVRDSKLSFWERISLLAAGGCLVLIFFGFAGAAVSFMSRELFQAILALSVGAHSICWNVSLALGWHKPVKRLVWLSWLISGYITWVLLLMISVRVAAKVLQIAPSELPIDSLFWVAGACVYATWFVLRNRRSDQVLMCVTILQVLACAWCAAFLAQAVHQQATSVLMTMKPQRSVIQALGPLAVTLLQVMPGVVGIAWLYFTRRLWKLPPGSHVCIGCHYDLTGTLRAMRTSCPECGASIAGPQEVTQP